MEEIHVGEKIKTAREDKALSLQELADQSGISPSLLSQIENHLISPGLGTLIRISKALEVEVGFFFKEHPEKSYSIVRKDERQLVSRFASKEGVSYGYTYESLGFDKKDRHMEPFLVTLEPATLGEQEFSSHDGEEFLFVLKGEMEVVLGDHSDVLHPGDSIYYDSRIPHRVSCVSGETTKILAILYTS